MKRNSIKFLGLIFLSGLVIHSCSDLEIEESDSIISEGFQGIADPASALDGLYGNIAGQYGDQANLFALAEVTTDAALVPTRGTDWGDNGLWRVLHAHNWPVDHQFFSAVWNQFNGNQLRASQILDERSGATSEVAGGASLLRAFSMWVILDNFGQVPYRDTALPSSSVPEVLTGQAALDFILSDLDTAIANLPTVTAGSGEANGRGSKAAARYLKAKVLLNKHIYLGGSPESGDMSQVISLVDAIAADGYALQEGFFDIFRDSPDSETIMWLSANVGNRIYNGLHYNSTSLGGGGWNGFSTLAEYYDMYEGDPNQNRVDADGNPLDGQEERRGGVPPSGDTPGSNVGFGYLIGQQYALDGTPLQDRAGNPLTFKRNFENGNGETSFINNDETTGIRVMKYNPRYGEGFINHEVFFRYADAHLMKAEAMMRSGQDPTTMVNELRVLRGASPLGSVSESDLLDERGRELYQEIWRRNDMIRFGQYTRDWLFKDESLIGDESRNLFPIPPAQLLANPALVQNPGY